MSSDEELEMLKKIRLARMQEALRQQQAIAEEIQREQEEEERKRQILRAILTTEARGRLANLSMVRPDLVATVENLLIQAYIQGKIRRQITDAELKEILKRILSSTKREINIRFM